MDIHPHEARRELNELRRRFLCAINPEEGPASAFVTDALDFMSLAVRALERAGDVLAHDPGNPGDA